MSRHSIESIERNEFEASITTSSLLISKLLQLHIYAMNVLHFSSVHFQLSKAQKAFFLPLFSLLIVCVACFFYSSGKFCVMEKFKFKSLLILLIALSQCRVSVALKDAESNQTGTITQFLKSQFALANKMQQQLSESGNADSSNFDGKYKLLLSGDLSSDLDLLNDSSEIDEPSEHDLFSSDDDEFFKLQFPESEPKLGVVKNNKNKENIYKVPKSKPLKKFNNSKNSSENSFEQFTRLYDHFVWNFENFNSSEISTMCVEDVQLYLNDLRSSKEWATKAVDASGRFRGLFFAENDFWLGSKDLCDEVNMETVGNRKIPRLEFFVMRLLLKFEHTKTQRILSVGQCLPDTCKPREVMDLMNLDTASINFRQKNELTIFEARKVPGDFNILQNTKFYIFG